MSLAVIGWLATAVFASSYLFHRPLTLRRIQAGAALLWVIYGVAIEAAPVVVANLIVAGAALCSSFAQRRPEDPTDDQTWGNPLRGAGREGDSPGSIDVR